MVNYNRLERPVQNDSAAIVVELGLTLLQIIDVVGVCTCVCVYLCVFFVRQEERLVCCSIQLSRNYFLLPSIPFHLTALQTLVSPFIRRPHLFVFSVFLCSPSLFELLPFWP